MVHCWVCQITVILHDLQTFGRVGMFCPPPTLKIASVSSSSYVTIHTIISPHQRVPQAPSGHRGCIFACAVVQSALVRLSKIYSALKETSD